MRLWAEPLTHVLVATDLSSGGDLAVARALRLPCAPRATLSLLHVVHGKTDSPRAHEEEASLARRLEEARLRAAKLAEGRDVGTLDIIPSMVRGKPSSEIVSATQQGGSELIVLGRHGKSPMRNMILGSTAREVIRQAAAPVLVVSQPASGPYRRPLVAVDFSETSRGALAVALRLADRETERIYVVHAHGARDEDLPLDLGATEYEHEARRRLDEFLRPFARAGISFTTVIERGDPREVIVDAAASRGCDLIAVGARGRSIVDGSPSSVARAVVEVARCDVLVVRSGDGAGSS